MNKPVAFTAFALLASLTGCTAPSAGEAPLGEAEQADVIGGTWTTGVLPRGAAGTAVCQVDTTTFTLHVSLPASSNTITLTEMDKCAGSDCKTSTNGAGPLTATTGGASAHFSNPAPGDGFSATVVAALDGAGDVTLGISTGTFQDGGSPPQDFGCSPLVLAYPTSSVTASSVAIAGAPTYVGSTFTGSYTFADENGHAESGTTYQWYRYTIATMTNAPISGATAESYVLTSADAGNEVSFCVTPATAYVTGAQVCTAGVSVNGALASSVAISGNPYVGSTLTGNWTFSDYGSLTERTPVYQWYTVSSTGTTAISGATSQTYVPTSSEIDQELQFCVTPQDTIGYGATVCSSTVTVPGVVWYTGESQTGAGVPETYSNGACVNVSSILTFNPASLALYGQASEETFIYFYTGSNCTGTKYSRNAGAGTVHDINLDTVGIGSSMASYQVSF